MKNGIPVASFCLWLFLHNPAEAQIRAGFFLGGQEERGMGLGTRPRGPWRAVSGAGWAGRALTASASLQKLGA